MTEDAEDLWAYAVALYGRDGVSDACLELQERFDADVPVLLYALWLAGRGCRLTPASMVMIDTEVGDWRREIVQSLRRVRQRLKTGPSPAPDSETDSLRAAVKAVELKAEKIELDHLAGLVRLGERVEPSADLYADNLATALALYAGATNLAAGEGSTLVLAAIAMQAP